jgi:hypothetical protein
MEPHYSYLRVAVFSFIKAFLTAQGIYLEMGRLFRILNGMVVDERGHALF